jgi:hypothetical protein
LLVPASHKIDPFNTLPVDERGNSQYLISKRKLPAGLSLSAFVIDNNLNNQVVFAFSDPTDHPYSPIKPCFGEEEGLKVIMSDSATLHITLSHVAMGLRSLPNIDLDSDVIYHLGKTIAIVNKRMGNFQYEAIRIQDKTIFVVSLLTHWEVQTYFPSAFSIIIANTITLSD